MSCLEETMAPNSFRIRQNVTCAGSDTVEPKIIEAANVEEEWTSASRIRLSELQLGKILGSGSFCKVRDVIGKRKSPFQCYQNVNRDGSHYAVKQLKNGLDVEDLAFGLEDLRNEADLLEKISHPNIIQIRGTAVEEENDSRFFIVLDLIEITLEQKIKKWEPIEYRGKRPWWKSFNYKHEMRALWNEKISTAYAISSAMHYLHEKNIIYRDLKPHNIGFNSRKKLKLYDLGMAKELDPNKRVGDNYNMTGLTGTMRYMSPEVFNEQPYNLSADVYSFGILFWYICSLKTPFYQYSMDMLRSDVANGLTRPEICESWQKEIGDLMRSCWDNDPSLRPSFLNILNALDKAKPS